MKITINARAMPHSVKFNAEYKKYLGKIKEALSKAKGPAPVDPSWIKFQFIFMAENKEAFGQPCCSFASGIVLGKPIMKMIGMNEKRLGSLGCSKNWGEKDKIIVEWGDEKDEPNTPDLPSENMKSISIPIDMAELSKAAEELDKQDERDWEESKKNGNLGVDLSDANINNNTDPESPFD